MSQTKVQNCNMSAAECDERLQKQVVEPIANCYAECTDNCLQSCSAEYDISGTGLDHVSILMPNKAYTDESAAKSHLANQMQLHREKELTNFMQSSAYAER